MFLIEQNKLDQGPLHGGGLEFTMPMTLGCVWAILCTDAVQGLEYKTRPYEVVPGRTDEVVRESIDYLCDVFRNRPHRGCKRGAFVWHLSTDYFVNALREVLRKFEAIEVDRLQPRPIVKLTGEFYLQTVEGDPNYNIYRRLEAEGAEVDPAPIVTWLDYLFRVYAQQIEEYIGIDRYARAKLALVYGLQRLYGWTYRRMRAALADIPHETPDQYELRRLAAPWISPSPAVGRRRRHAGRQGAVGASPQEGAHDLRAVALCLHAEHDEHRRHGRCDRSSIPTCSTRRSRSRVTPRCMRFALPE